MSFIPRTKVPCNGCTACCRNHIVVLKPEHGDVVEEYEHEIIQHPRTREILPVLKHTEDGACVYLTDKGCGIWERAPSVCRAYDCRIRFASLTRNERRTGIKVHNGHCLHNAEALEEGRKRLNTLTPEERANARELVKKWP